MRLGDRANLMGPDEKETFLEVIADVLAGWDFTAEQIAEDLRDMGVEEEDAYFATRAAVRNIEAEERDSVWG